MSPPPTAAPAELTMEVLRQFRVIYGTMRHYFREVEERCALPGSHMWILQEVERSPGLGVTELAERLGIHQSTSSLLVDKLVTDGYLEKKRQKDDRRRVGLWLKQKARKPLAALPGPAEGVLPRALMDTPEVVLKTLAINLHELLQRLPGKDDGYADIPLADIDNQHPR